MPYMRLVVRPGAVAALNVSAVVRHVADMVADDARRIVPVDTGRLKASIQVEDAGREKARVHASAPYAGYVELGTRYMNAQPYLRPSLYKWRGRVA